MIVLDSKENLLKSDDEEDLIFDHSTLLHKDVGFRENGYRCCPSGGKLQIAKTINLCLSFFGLGLCFAIPTATLNDLQMAVQSANENIKNIYTARYSGYLFGAIIGGFLFDCYNRQFLLFCSLVATGIGIIIMPFCRELISLMACTAVTGVTMGFLDTGGNVWCLDLWGQRSAPFLMALHASFGLGAFVAPIVAEPFLSPFSTDVAIEMNENYTFANGSLLSVPRVGLPQYPLIRSKHILTKHSLNYIEIPFQLEKQYEFERTKREASNETNWYKNDTDISFGSDINVTESNDTSTKSPDQNLNLTTLINVKSTMPPIVKPKPAYADGNQLFQDDKWNKKKMIDQIKSATSAPVSVVNVTTASNATSMVIANNSTSTTPLPSSTKSQEETTTMDEISGNLTLASTLTEEQTSTFASTTSMKILTSATLSTTLEAARQAGTTPKPDISTLPIENIENSSHVSVTTKMTYFAETKPLQHILKQAFNMSDFKVTTDPPKSLTSYKPYLKSVNDLLTTEAKLVKSVKKDKPKSPEETSYPSVVSDHSEPQNIVLGKIPQPMMKKIQQIPTSHTEQPTTTTLKSTTIESSSMIPLNDDPSLPVSENSLDGKNSTSKSWENDVFSKLFNFLRKNRLGKFEVPYILLAVYIFVVAIVFLVFLCKNPRESRSLQLESNKSRDLTLSFRVVMVGLMSLFLCLYVGIEVGVGELLETFATKENLQLPQSRGFFLPYCFWGSFAFSRIVSIFVATRFSSRCMLITNLSVCMVASITLVAFADKLEPLLWIGIVLLGFSMGPLFPASISWLERYVLITNKTASIFVLGAAVGEIVIPVIIDLFINQEPMVLMYVNITVNVLCFSSFICLILLAKHTKNGGKKPNRSMYELANSHDYDDSSELLTTNSDVAKSTTNGYYLPIKNRHIASNGNEFQRN